MRTVVYVILMGLSVIWTTSYMAKGQYGKAFLPGVVVMVLWNLWRL